MAGEITLNVADGDQGVALEFNDLGELAELLKLAGVSGKCDTVEPTGDVAVDSMIPIPGQTDENADHDYGINPTSRKGYVYDVDPYKYQGDAEIPTRYVPAKSADNPLVKEGKPFISYLKEIEASRKSTKGRRHTRRANRL